MIAEKGKLVNIAYCDHNAIPLRTPPKSLSLRESGMTCAWKMKDVTQDDQSDTIDIA